MANKLQWRFIAANLHALLTGQFSVLGGHLPPGGHRVPADFCGVGVATNPDPLTDDAVISALHDLGVKQVRLDVTYGDLDNHVARFLERLLTEDFKVMLHILQPFEAARAMPSPEAATQWRDFLIATLDRFGSQVEIVELCSTINRTRWAGYSLEGFLSSWRVGHEEIRKRNLVLAGPSITDFEPPWTVGVLDMLARENLLPDIHTDNLFAERATEPERWDQKVLGHRLAPLLRLNLIKKARLLARLGARVGVPRMMSPAAFWTLPRIERQLPDSEEKQADYLARYMVLCAASGALERASWGPLVCHREGLIDDGRHTYPKLERITHYASVDGTTNDFRRRPAFEALASFNRLIPGSVYEGRCGKGVEIHCFRSTEYRTHAVWTMNGFAAAACDAYDADDLAAAEWLDRDGRPLTEAPTLFDESPVFLRWPVSRSVSPNDSADILKGVRIHRHDHRHHFYYRDINWHGMVLADNRAEADALFALLQPDRLAPPKPKADTNLRYARNAIWTVAHPTQATHRLAIKQPVKHHPHKKLLDRLKPSKALRSWNGAAELSRMGLDTARAVAWFELRSGRDIRKNWYVCDFLPDRLSAGQMFACLRAGTPLPEGTEEDRLFQSLAYFVARVHARGIVFRDLSGGNVLAEATPGKSSMSFALIDTARLRVLQHRGLRSSERASDLVRLCHKLPEPKRQTFLRYYCKAAKLRHSPVSSLRFLSYDLKVALKRRLRKTRLYKSLKR